MPTGEDDKLIRRDSSNAALEEQEGKQSTSCLLLNSHQNFLCRSAKFRSVERRIGAGDVVQCRRLIDCGTLLSRKHFEDQKEAVWINCALFTFQNPSQNT